MPYLWLSCANILLKKCTSKPLEEKLSHFKLLSLFLTKFQIQSLSLTNLYIPVLLYSPQKNIRKPEVFSENQDLFSTTIVELFCQIKTSEIFFIQFFEVENLVVTYKHCRFLKMHCRFLSRPSKEYFLTDRHRMFVTISNSCVTAEIV